MLKWKRLMMVTLSTSILLTQGGPLPYLAYAMEEARNAPVNGEVKFSWTTADQVTVGTMFNPYAGLEAIDADGDNVAVLTQVEGEVDTKNIGVYSLTYSITNVDGETFNTTREIEVIQPTVEEDNEELNEHATEETIDNTGPAIDSEEQTESDDSTETLINEKIEQSKFELYQAVSNEDGWSHESFFTLGFNVQTATYLVEFFPEIWQTSEQETQDVELFELTILTKDNQEKFKSLIRISDLMNEELLSQLNALAYVEGDQISLRLKDLQTILPVVHGVTDGDVTQEQEDYQDGIQNADYLDNVRFQLTDQGLKTIYNEAPVINGLNDLEVITKDDIDPLEGISLSDDKDENLSLDAIKVAIEDESDSAIVYRYTITDSWGRSTIGTRQIRIVPMAPIELYISDDSSAQATTSLGDTLIHVGGVTYQGNPTDDLTTRFQIKFDTTSKEIKLSNQDGRVMDQTYKDRDYFKFELYDKNMNLKASVTLTGRDKSDSSKLNAIKNHVYEIGDYISLWHVKTEDESAIQEDGDASEDGGTPENETRTSEEGPTNKEKLWITGSALISGDSTVNYNKGIPYKETSEQRYRITEQGLEIVTNTAPTLKDSENNTLSNLKLQLNQDYDLIKELRVKLTDDKDSVQKLKIEHSHFSTSATGTYHVTYSVKDTWGAVLELTQIIEVTSGNRLNNTYFEVYTRNNQLAFTMTFNALDNKLVLLNNYDKQLDPSNEGVVFRLKVIRDNVVQRVLGLKGTDMTEDIVRSKLNGYKYEIGDQIEIWSTYPETGIKIKGQIEGIPDNGEDYSDGIQSEDAMNNVRFEIKERKIEVGENDQTDNEAAQPSEKDNWLQYVYNAAPVFNDLQPLLITRTVPTDYLSGVKVTDEDTDIMSKIIYGTLSEKQLNTAGTYEIRYRVTDSWGRSTSIVRQVIVQPYAPLESQEIVVSVPYGDDLLFRLGFDENNSENMTPGIIGKSSEDSPEGGPGNGSEEEPQEGAPQEETPEEKPAPYNKRKIKVLEFKALTASEDLEETLIKIGLYNQNGQPKQTLELTKEKLTNEVWIQTIESWTYDSTDYIRVWSVDYQGVVIKNHEALDSVSNDNEETIGATFGFEDEDKMNNTRFQLQDTGLVAKYNKAPVFEGLEPLYVYKGTTLTLDMLKKDVTVDDEDTNLTFTVTERDEDEPTHQYNVETNEIGDYSITYKVTDSWGRTTVQSRQVSVISRATENTVELYNEQNEKFLMFRYNPIKGGFDVTKYSIQSDETNPINSDETENEEVTDINETLFTISLFDSNHQQVYKLDLNAQNWKAEGFFDEFEEVEMQHGYYFNIVAKDPKKVKIQGTIKPDSEENVEDTSPEEEGNTEGGSTLEGDTEESASPEEGDIVAQINDQENVEADSTENIDYSNGVMNPDHLTNVRFKLTEDGLEAVYNKAPKILFKSRELFTVLAGDPIDYFTGVSVIDDHDGIIENSADNIKISYGTKNDQTNKTENDLIIGGNTIYYSVTDSWGRSTTVERQLMIANGVSKNEISLYSYQTGTNQEDEKYVSIRFVDNGTGTGGTFNVKTVDNILNIALQGGKNFEFTLLGSNNERKAHVMVKGNDNANLFNELNGKSFQYGDKIKIFAWHPIRVKMDGIVSGSREDYSDGFDNPLNLLNAEFEITSSGLKSIYTETNTTQEHQNSLAVIAPEGIPLKLTFTPNQDSQSGSISLTANGDYSILYGTSDKVLELWLYSPNGQEKKHIFANGDYRTNRIDGLNDFNSYQIGDYLKVWHKYPFRMTVYGDVINQKEDYSDGFNDEDSVNYTVFKLTANGFEAVYNEAPKIVGAEDKDIVLGQAFNPLEGVTVEDDHDSELKVVSVEDDESLETANVNSDTVQGNNSKVVRLTVSGSVDPNQLGEQKLIYKATDSWGKVTTLERTITVKPQLDFSVFKVYSATNKNTPSFEIGFDSSTKQYRVFNQTTDRLDANNPNEEIVRIEIRRPSTTKATDEVLRTIVLTGNDRGTSSNLNDLNKFSYEPGDIIRIYHRDGPEGVDFIINGGIPWSLDSLTSDDDLILEQILMKNTGFKIVEEVFEPEPESDIESSPVTKTQDNLVDEQSQSEGEAQGETSGDTTVMQARLEIISNEAPKINGVNANLTISKGTSLDLLSEIVVTDKIDGNIHNSNIIVKVNGEIIARPESDPTPTSDSNSITLNHIFNRIGEYTVTYQVTDSWGYTTLATSQIKVESKTKENTIDVYGANDALAFKVTFDTDNNQFVLTDGSISNESGPSLFTSDYYFEMIVRSMDGKTKYTVQLTDDLTIDRQQLSQIHEHSFELYDTIALKSTSPTAIKINGSVVDVEDSYDYSQGFGTIDKYSEVRFQITEDGLKEIQKPTLTINSISNSIEIIRGNEINLETLVTIDGIPENSEDFELQIDQGEYDNLLEGTYQINYTVTTSWEESVTQWVNVTVKSRNQLEENTLEVYDIYKKKILTIGFDTMTRKLRVIQSNSGKIDQQERNAVVRLFAYDDNGKILKTLELPGNVAITDEIINRINNFSYENVAMIGVWAKKIESIKISGHIGGEVPEEKEDTDYMNNVRFKIAESGLEAVYNNAPEITISSLPKDEMTLYKGNNLEMPLGITVTDDLDKQISSSLVSINDSGVDYDVISNHTVYFEVEDSWGRVGSKKITLKILPPLEHNQIKILPLGSTNKALVMSFTEDSKITFTQEAVQESTPEVSELSESSSITVRLYHLSEVKEELTLTASDTSSKIAELILKEWKFEAGGDYYIAFEGEGTDIHNKIQIHGSVNSGKVNYSEGISSTVDLANTRFRLSDLGIETVYNAAPTIIILPNDEDSEDTTITAVKGDVIDFGYNVILSDDHDDLDFDSNVTITLIPQQKESEQTEDNTDSSDNKVDAIFSNGQIGTNTVQYTVTDSWGRTATETREIELTNALSQVTIQMFGHKGRTSPAVVTDLVLEMTFDPSKMKIETQLKVEESEEGYYFNYNNNENKQYEVSLYRVSENAQLASETLTLLGNTKVTTGNGNNTLKKWVDEGISFKYGDYLHLKAWHQDTLKIQGPVRNALEDYSDGVQLGDSYTNVYFKITDSGLECNYIDNYIKEGSHENVILPTAREGFPMQIRLKPTEATVGDEPSADTEVDELSQAQDTAVHQIIFEKLTSYSMQFTTDGTGNALAFRLSMYDELGSKISDLTMTKNDNPKAVKNKIEEFVNALNAKTGRTSNLPSDKIVGTYREGYYLEVVHITPKYLRIMGDIEGEPEDYSDGIDNSEYMWHVVFELTSEGMKCRYIGEPEITGIEALKIEYEVGTTVRETELKTKLLDGIKVNDRSFADILTEQNSLGRLEYTSLDYSQNTYQISNAEGNQERMYNFDTVGVYFATYTYGSTTTQNSYEVGSTVTNLSQRNNRSTMKRATITVYDRPVVHKVNNEEVNVVEAGEYSSKLEWEDYLRRLVTITDMEDKDVPIALEIEDDSANPFDPYKVGEYTLTYTAIDSGGHKSDSVQVKIQVVRTISVSVPHTIPFQVVTNLIAGNEDSPFIAGIMKFSNNTLTPVDVYVRSVTKVDKSGNLTLVDPTTFENWSTISEADSMNKMALGLYQKDGFIQSDYTRDEPFWLIPQAEGIEPLIAPTYIGTLPRRENKEVEPAVGRLTLTSKHGQIFHFGKTSGKFKITFEFR